MRYTGPTTRINRRFKMEIFPITSAYERKQYLPGVHGPRLKRRMSGYSLRLNEKQKLLFMFGLSEKQFRLTFEKAKRLKGITGEVFLSLLETRLDNILYRLGFAKTRRCGRQMVLHGHVKVDGQKVDIPSYNCRPGELISLVDKPSARQLATRNFEASQGRNCPAWLSVKTDKLEGSVDRLPIKDELQGDINVQLIVEYYSR